MGQQGNGLLDRDVWDRLVNYIARDADMDQSLAERVMDEVVAFLILIARSGTDATYSPSRLVDVGWHAFILHTQQYHEFCEKVAGRFLHHTPADIGTPTPHTRGIARTKEALIQAGIGIDEQLWVDEADCQGQKCYGGDCTGGGPPMPKESAVYS